ncbi:Ubiquitin carboxyl-terminal hydrolase CYLD [Varanus komodoensis]|nr:Ubiquitin carboxyl-terminal hydrolase CYLD [Varanus komodoensis]
MNTVVMQSSHQILQGDKNIYYILTEDIPYGSKLFIAGSMCYLNEQTYLKQINLTFSNYWRFVMEEDGTVATMNVNNLQPLSDKKANFLSAISNVHERLDCFLDGHVLDAAMNAKPGQQVFVECNQQTLFGIVRYIGQLSRNSLPSGLCPVYFGVELQGDGEGKGCCDGTYNGTEYFTCKQNCGLFLPFNKLRFLPALEDDEEKREAKPDAAGAVPVKVGDAVGFYLDDHLTRGVAMDVYQENGTWMVQVCPEEEGFTDLFRNIPLDSVVKEELLSPGFEIDSDCGLTEQLQRRRSDRGEDWEVRPALSVNSVVLIELDKGNPVTGTIRWIGCLPKMPQKMAGIELDDEKGVCDGEFEGVRYFTCPPKRGLFAALESCQPDMRFQCSGPRSLESVELRGSDAAVVQSSLPPLRDDMAMRVLQGRMRGIQGHCNSCYMDAALFSLFSCSSVLDSMLFKPPPPHNGHIQEILRDKIVNPLRQNGFVAAKSVMGLRHQLTEKGPCSSFATSEKDPEEFLNLIMHHVLGMEPLLKLQSGKLKEQDCYCYQIFMDKQEDLVVPSVQQLVEHSFLSSDLKLVEEYKMFSKIVPSLELDITDLLLDGPRECFVCGGIATWECSACFKDRMFAHTGLKQYCDSCCAQAHSHYQRRSHRPTRLRVPEEFCRARRASGLQVPREKLELFAVLCIETSHYVSFVKYGPEMGHWMFFDSMADRHGDENGYNIPKVSPCPEVARYLEMPVAALAMEQPREMGVAKRLFCDAYMYMYQSKKMSLYR